MFRWARIKKCLERPWAAYTFAICAGVVLFLFLSHFGILLILLLNALYMWDGAGG